MWFLLPMRQGPGQRRTAGCYTASSLTSLIKTLKSSTTFSVFFSWTHGSYAGQACHSVLLLLFRSSFFFLFFAAWYVSDIAPSIVSKLCHNMFDGDPGL